MKGLFLTLSLFSFLFNWKRELEFCVRFLRRLYQIIMSCGAWVKTTEMDISQFRKPESETELSAGLCSLWSLLGGTHPGLFQLLVAPGNAWCGLAFGCITAIVSGTDSRRYLRIKWEVMNIRAGHTVGWMHDKIRSSSSRSSSSSSSSI